MLGDAVEKAIRYILGDKLTDKIHDSGCGCDQRREWLNEMHRRVIDWLKWKFN